MTSSSKDGRAGPASHELWTRAQHNIPGGVNSPVRAFRAVGGDPPFIESARGPYLRTADGVDLIDYVGSWGPAILGHAHPEVVEAVCRAAERGLSFGAVSGPEVEMAARLCELVPCLRDGQVRLVSSGTEATMSALRLARGATGRSKIVKCDGAYHGHADALLVAAGSGAATLGLPGSAGVPAGAVADTFVVAHNDLAAMQQLFAEHGHEIAAIIIEPVAGNMGFVAPAPGWLEGLRALCDASGSLLIFDEVMTGFRVALGGAQAQYGVTPDLCCLGKVVGGGMPVGAYGGRRDIMANIAPLGPVYQAGTLSGNPLSVAAGLKTLEILVRDDPFPVLSQRTRRLVEGLSERASARGIAWQGDCVGAMWGGFFNANAVVDYASAKTSDTAAFGRFFQAMLSRGVYLAPSQFEAGFVSIAHDDAIIDRTLEAAADSFASL